MRRCVDAVLWTETLNLLNKPCFYVSIGTACVSKITTSVRRAVFQHWHRPTIVFPLIYCPVKHDSWPIQPDILSPPLLRLTSRKPLWQDLQPVDIKSRWRHNWKLAQMVNSHLVCDPTIRQPGFNLPRQQWSLLNHFRMVPAEGNGDLQTLICVLVARPRQCLTLSNPVPWQNWMAAYLGYTLQMKTLFRGWQWIRPNVRHMAHETGASSHYCCYGNHAAGSKPI